jgi:hypothetical protein
MDLIEIDKLANAIKSKAILTSRIEYFTSVSEEEKALRPKGQSSQLEQQNIFN